MLEKIISIDKHVLIFLNNLGSTQYDSFWLIVTKQLYWLPFFLILFYLLQKNIGWKNLGFVLLFIALILLCCNTTVEFCKTYFHRLRPCNDPEIKGVIRIIHQTSTFSFISGHAANSFATMTMIFLILKEYYKNAFLIFLYPLIFAYSRIYLGVHFPGDILVGFLVGALFGIVFFKLYELFLIKLNSPKI